MNRAISILLILAICFSLAACGSSENGDLEPNANEPVTNAISDYVYKDTYLKNDNPNNPTVMGLFYRNIAGANIESDDPDILEIDKKADAMLKKIEEYPDNIEVSGKTYYLSNEGDDKNDGLTPETARATYEAVKMDLQPGDALLFRRGDIFRGQMPLKTGVAYGAFGEGVKPRIYGSRDAKEYKWVEIEDDIYEYTGITGDVSNVIFNNGEFIGRPVGSEGRLRQRKLNIYLGSRLTIYSPDGNPGEIFHSIEIADGRTLLPGSGGGLKDVKIQNLCLMYTGVHFLGTLGSVEGMEVEGCIMGYCGGKNLYAGRGDVSLGNAIEFWSQAKNVYIHDNYIFQAYDAALTHQGPTKTNDDGGQISKTDYTNIHYENNLLEYNTYDIEAFSLRSVAEQKNSPNGTFTYNDVYVKGNICRYTGWGWGSLDRPDKNVYANFKYDAQGGQDENGNYTNIHIKPLYIENNIFDRTRKRVLGISSPAFNKANMILKNNEFYETKNANIFAGEKITGNYMEKINQHFTASGNKFKQVD